MPGRLAGKVAFITGAARGQGRAHALGMAREGADIVAIDICAPIASNPYPLASREDFAETERAVKELGRRGVFRVADVRERGELREAVEVGVTELGGLDIVVANAGILPMAMGSPDPMHFVDATDVDLLGVMNTVAVAVPHLAEKSSVIITGSTAGMMPGNADSPEMGPGGAGYAWSKRTLMQYAEQMAVHLASRFIRVNVIHPTNCNTGLLHNDGIYGVFRPDVAGRGVSPPARTPSWRSPTSRRCRFRTSSPRTSPTWRSSWPVTTAATSPVSRSGWMRAHCSSSRTDLAADRCAVAAQASASAASSRLTTLPTSLRGSWSTNTTRTGTR